MTIRDQAFVEDFTRDIQRELSMPTLDSPFMIEAAGLIADGLITDPGNKQPRWDESARNFIQALCLHLATDPLYESESSPDRLRKKER